MVTSTTSARRCTSTPSETSTAASSSLRPGSSSARSRARCSNRVTVTPSRLRAWASSTPVGPPPMTTSDDGGASIAKRSSVVRNPAVGQTLDGRHQGAAARGQQDGRGVQRPRAVDGHLLRAGHHPGAGDDVDPDQAAAGLVDRERRLEDLDPLPDRGKVDGRRRRRKAEAVGRPHRVRRSGRRHQCLRGHVAGPRRGTTGTVALDHGHAEAQRGGHPSGGESPEPMPTMTRS